MKDTSMTTWRRSAFLAACVCVGLAGAARADTYAYLYDGDYSFGVADLTTGAYDLCGNSGLLLAGLAEDPSGNVYGAAFGGTALYKINPSNGSLTLIGNAPIAIYGLGSTTKHVYALDANFNLYRVDTTTAATTEIGPTGLNFNNDYGLSTGSGRLFYETNGTLYSINAKTGVATRKGTGTGATNIGALMVSNRVLYGAAGGPPTVWKIRMGSGIETQGSTIGNATNSPWGMAPAPSGTCPN